MNTSTILAVCLGGILTGYAFFMCSVRLIAILQQQGYAVSYTHLTLPTIAIV